jgi:hypothetical protein
VRLWASTWQGQGGFIQRSRESLMIPIRCEVGKVEPEVERVQCTVQTTRISSRPPPRRNNRCQLRPVPCAQPFLHALSSQTCCTRDITLHFNIACDQELTLSLSPSLSLYAPQPQISYGPQHTSYTTPSQSWTNSPVTQTATTLATGETGSVPSYPSSLQTGSAARAQRQATCHIVCWGDVLQVGF